MDHRLLSEGSTYEIQRRQCSYFSKKGMNLHADDFLLQSTAGGNKQ